MENIKLTLLIGAMSIAACSPPMDRAYLVDGPRNPMFGADLRECKQLAQDSQIGAGAEGALIGAASGAVFGGLEPESDTETVLVGAGIGALAGTAAAHDASETAKREVVIRCLQNRGHAVIN